MTFDRRIWIDLTLRVASPVLLAASNRSLKSTLPTERVATSDWKSHNHLEAFARTLAGIAPWFESGDSESLIWAERARLGLASMVDADSPDTCDFSSPAQTLVETAFLAMALVRAPKTLWHPLPDIEKLRVISALQKSRGIQPYFNNWLLFSAMVEAALFSLGQNDWDRMRVDYALRQFDQWYVGDGLYADGPAFHMDCYNSVVIHPMLLEIATVMVGQGWDALFKKHHPRALRCGAILERMISPEGTFPVVGRSVTGRLATFHLLAHLAWKNTLPEAVTPAQVRCALTAVMKRALNAPGTFDEAGWLRMGLCGHQPWLGEKYMTTGSLYSTSFVFLPLGHLENEPFWADADAPWTSVHIWNGDICPIDKALSD